MQPVAGVGSTQEAATTDSVSSAAQGRTKLAGEQLAGMQQQGDSKKGPPGATAVAANGGVKAHATGGSKAAAANKQKGSSPAGCLYWVTRQSPTNYDMVGGVVWVQPFMNHSEQCCLRSSGKCKGGMGAHACLLLDMSCLAPVYGVTWTTGVHVLKHRTSCCGMVLVSVLHAGTGPPVCPPGQLALCSAVCTCSMGFASITTFPCLALCDLAHQSTQHCWQLTVLDRDWCTCLAMTSELSTRLLLHVRAAVH